MNIFPDSDNPSTWKNAEICPFLGLADDPQTALSFPSVWNACQHARPAAAPKLDHQRLFCLQATHSICPVSLRNGGKPLPAELRLAEPHPFPRKRLLVPILAAGLLILVLVVIGSLWPFL